MLRFFIFNLLRKFYSKGDKEKRKKKERKEKKEKKLETRSTHNRRCAQSVVANFPRRWNSGLLAQHLSHPPNKKSSGGDKRVPRGDISREDRG